LESPLSNVQRLQGFKPVEIKDILWIPFQTEYDTSTFKSITEYWIDEDDPSDNGRGLNFLLKALGNTAGPLPGRRSWQMKSEPLQSRLRHLPQ
jgi:hypothetical protein